MSVESVTYISDLDETLPPRSDQRREGADHLRNIKKGIRLTFPNVSGEVTADQLALNTSVKLHRQRMFFFGQQG